MPGSGVLDSWMRAAQHRVLVGSVLVLARQHQHREEISKLTIALWIEKLIRIVISNPLLLTMT